MSWDHFQIMPIQKVLVMKIFTFTWLSWDHFQNNAYPQCSSAPNENIYMVIEGSWEWKLFISTNHKYLHLIVYWLGKTNLCLKKLLWNLHAHCIIYIKKIHFCQNILSFLLIVTSTIYQLSNNWETFAWARYKIKKSEHIITYNLSNSS